MHVRHELASPGDAVARRARQLSTAAQRIRSPGHLGRAVEGLGAPLPDAQEGRRVVHAHVRLLLEHVQDALVHQSWRDGGVAGLLLLPRAGGRAGSGAERAKRSISCAIMHIPGNGLPSVSVPLSHRASRARTKPNVVSWKSPCT